MGKFWHAGVFWNIASSKTKNPGQGLVHILYLARKQKESLWQVRFSSSKRWNVEYFFLFSPFETPKKLKNLFKVVPYHFLFNNLSDKEPGPLKKPVRLQSSVLALQCCLWRSHQVVILLIKLAHAFHIMKICVMNSTSEQSIWFIKNPPNNTNSSTYRSGWFHFVHFDLTKTRAILIETPSLTKSVLVLRERNWYYHDNPARENLFI